MIQQKIFTLILFSLLSSYSFSEIVLSDYAFTTNTKNFQPQENHEVLTFQDSHVYLFTHWKGLENDKIYNIRYIITDSVDRVLYNRDAVFKTSNGARRMWAKYTFKRDRDYPGDWTFKALIDDALYFEKKIYVGE
jgi:hypothetical protein